MAPCAAANLHEGTPSRFAWLKRASPEFSGEEPGAEVCNHPGLRVGDASRFDDLRCGFNEETTAVIGRRQACVDDAMGRAMKPVFDLVAGHIDVEQDMLNPRRLKRGAEFSCVARSKGALGAIGDDHQIGFGAIVLADRLVRGELTAKLLRARPQEVDQNRIAEDFIGLSLRPPVHMLRADSHALSAAARVPDGPEQFGVAQMRGRPQGMGEDMGRLGADVLSDDANLISYARTLQQNSKIEPGSVEAAANDLHVSIPWICF